MKKRLDDGAGINVEVLKVINDWGWAVLLENDIEDFFDNVVVDLASYHPFIQSDAPGVRPVHHLVTLSMQTGLQER